jgi:ATP-dependent DNA ligase
MLARLSRELPRGPYLYEPKWDGFRCLAFASRGAVVLQSRNGRPLDRYFPEIVDSLAGRELVLDGELVVRAGGGMDFGALMMRLHPAASRVAELAARQPASYIAFDLLAVGDADLTGRPFADRRDALKRHLGDTRAPLSLTPATSDFELASHWLETFDGHGLEGVMAKPLHARYEPGKRAMIKVKKERTVDCVVAGMRRFGAQPVVGALLLGLHDGELLRHVGVCTSFSSDRRRELAEELAPLVTPLAGHPWEHGFQLGPSPMGRLPGAAGRWSPEEMTQAFTPLAPTRVAEVGYDQRDGHRFRHALRFRRWRPDREPASCTFEQLERAAPEDSP